VVKRMPSSKICYSLIRQDIRGGKSIELCQGARRNACSFMNINAMDTDIRLRRIY
jgi:hypothetical protein